LIILSLENDAGYHLLSRAVGVAMNEIPRRASWYLPGLELTRYGLFVTPDWFNGMPAVRQGYTISLILSPGPKGNETASFASQGGYHNLDQISSDKIILLATETDRQ